MADDVTPSLGLSTDSAGAFTQRSVDGRRLGECLSQGGRQIGFLHCIVT